MADKLTSSDVGAGARAKINAAIDALNTVLGQIGDKAAQSALSSLASTVSGLATTLASKANQDGLAAEVGFRETAIRDTLAAVNAADLALGRRIDSKADQSALGSEVAARIDADQGIIKLLNDSDAGILKAAFDSDAGILAEVNASASRLVARAESTDAAVNSRFDVIEGAAPNARPGDMPSAFTRFTTGGVPEFLPNIAGLVAVGDNGRVLRIVGPDERPIVMRRYQRIEAGRRYRPRTVVRRRINATDPANDTVRSVMFWSGQSRERIGASVVADIADLRVDSGRRQLDGIVATSTGDGITVVAPAGAVYAQLGVICFGGIHVTDIEVIDLVDVTDAVVSAPNLSAFESRLGGLESQSLDPRLTQVEASIGAPNTKTYTSRVAAQSETVPATVTTLRTLGYLTAGDGGDDFYSRTGTSAGDFQTNGGAIGWRRVVGPVKPEHFGAKGDGTTNDRTALAAATAYALANGVRLILSKPYNVGTATPVVILGAITAEVGPNAKLIGNYDLHDPVTVTSALRVERQDPFNRYPPLLVHPNYRRPIAEKTFHLSHGDINYDRVVKIPGTGLLLQRLNWQPQNVDDWVAETSAGFNADLLSYNLTNDGYMHGGFRAAHGGDELSTSWDSGDYLRCAFLRGSFGTIVAYTSGDGSLVIATKLRGQAATNQTGIDWTGRADHPAQYPSNAVWTIRLYSLTQWTLMINGAEIMQPQTIPSGFLTHIGFGAYGDRTVRAAMNFHTLTRSTRTPGRAYFDILFLGDSTTADIHGAYPAAVVEALHGSLGASVRRAVNLAGDGHTSVQQYSVLQATDLTPYSDVVINIGTNDVQNPAAAGTRTESLARIGQMIDYCQTRFKRVTIAIFPTWYEKDRTNAYPGGAVGVFTSNASLSSTYRQGIKALAASKSCKVVDLNEEMEQALAYALTNAQPDIVLRDNIHQTEFRNRMNGYAVAAAMLGQWPQKSRALTETPLPADALRSNWVAGTPAANVTITRDGMAKIAGALKSGTMSSSGVVVLQLPFNLYPRSVKIGLLRGNANGAPSSSPTYTLNTGGTLTVFGGTETELNLDSIPAFEVAD